MKSGVSQSDRALEFLEKKIRDGSLKPGERIDLAAIAAELAISRQPIRDALKLLEGESIVRSAPHVGFNVARYTPSERVDIATLHALIECEIAQLAAERRTELQMLGLRAVSHECRATFVPGARAAEVVGALDSLGRQFHHVLYEMVDSPSLRALASPSFLRYQLACNHNDRRRMMSVLNRLVANMCDEHDELIDAIDARDGEAAREIMMRHFEGHLAMIRSSTRSDDDETSV